MRTSSLILSLAAASTTFVSTAALADGTDVIIRNPGPIGNVELISRDVVPVGITITSLGGGEFPQLHGQIRIKNMGNRAVSYVGPQTCQENPFGGAPTCYDVTTLKVNELYAWVYDTKYTLQPGETRTLSFSAASTDFSLKHCGTARVSFDIARKWNQFVMSPSGTAVYENDTATLTTVFSGQTTLCRIIRPIPLPL
jgi:hypothetical protein